MDIDKSLIGLIGAIIYLPAAFYYFYTIVRGDTRPHPVSWGVWSLIGILGVGATIEGGAGAGAYASLVALGISVIVFLLSLNKKYGKPGMEWYDIPLGIAAVAGIIFWKFGDLSPNMAVTIAIVADSVVCWLTLREAWRNPETESFLGWFSGAIALFLGTLAIENYTYEAAAYPIYLFIGNSLITSALAANALGIKKKSKKRRKQKH